MTNADRIRNMSNWELAEFIYNVSNEDKHLRGRMCKVRV